MEGVVARGITYKTCCLTKSIVMKDETVRSIEIERQRMKACAKPETQAAVKMLSRCKCVQLSLYFLCVYARLIDFATQDLKRCLS